MHCGGKDAKDFEYSVNNPQSVNYKHHAVMDNWGRDFYAENITIENTWGTGRTFYNVRSGAIITAPCHTNARYGYVFRDCIVDGNEKAADGKVKLGRPWHNNPVNVWINTTMRIPVAPEGWTDMGTSPVTISAEEASRCTYENMIMGSDQWNPRLYMKPLAAPAKLRYKRGVLQWKPVSEYGHLGEKISVNQ